MSELGKFIAFQAAVNLLKRSGKAHLLSDIYDACKAELAKPGEDRINQVKRIYKNFTDDEISKEIGRMVYPEDLEWSGEVDVMFLTVENLRACIKGPCGDWYFTGDYPTPGGFAVVNLAYVKWFEGAEGRSYDLPL